MTSSAPRRRTFAPKPWTAGEPVSWDGRSGIVWGDGPAPVSVWVAEDGDPSRMVAVKKPTARYEARTLYAMTPEAQRERLQRANRILAGLVAERVPVQVWTAYGSREGVRVVLHTAAVPCGWLDPAHEIGTPALPVAEYVRAALAGSLESLVGANLCACLLHGETTGPRAAEAGA